MNKTLLMMEALDAQLTILAIEGICSDHQVYEDEETEIEERECEACGGSGEIDIDPDDFHFDDFNDEFLIDDLIMRGTIECEKCEGTGVELTEKKVTYRDSWTTSNIFI